MTTQSPFMSSELNMKAFKQNLSLCSGIRCSHTEARLQHCLDSGGKIFVVGDIHGHFETFRALTFRLKLRDHDVLVCLGDMIDRGPNSAELISFIRHHDNIICIKGNHEQMAVQCITKDGTFEVWKPWMDRGGKSTYGSYIIQANGDLWKAKAKMIEDFAWLDTLPTEIVLERFRFVHAGYDPHLPINEQSEAEHLWIRKKWYQSDRVIDDKRTIFYGHSTTTKFGQGGDIVPSEHKISDGRNAWIAVDVGAYNHVLPSLVAVNVETLSVTRQQTVPSEQWFADGLDIVVQKKPQRWKRPSMKKESDTAMHFGLQILRDRLHKHPQRERMEMAKLRATGLKFHKARHGGRRKVGGYKFRVYPKKAKSVLNHSIQSAKVV